ncbi:MAG: fatty acid desaturase [Planctomycetota bacterium]
MPGTAAPPLAAPPDAPTRRPFAKRLRMIVAVEVLPLLGALGAVWLAFADGLWTLDLALLLGFYGFTMLGIEMGMHRLIAHRQFETVAPIRYLLAIAGGMAGEGSALLWSAIHREHHQTSDTPRDPHSPVHGLDGSGGALRRFAWAQCAWYGELEGIVTFNRTLPRVVAGEVARDDPDPAAVYARRVHDWTRDRTLLAIDRLYPVWTLLGFVLPSLIGLAVAGPWGALHGLLWGGFMRHFLVKQVSFAINSIGHTVGTKRYQAPDESRNNPVMAALTLGSGWHNNHHAFPDSAFTSLRWWHLDPTGWLISALEAVGLAWDVQRVDPARVRAARLS